MGLTRTSPLACSGWGLVHNTILHPAVPNLHISLFGVIPKKTTDKWLLIVDPSSPPQENINGGIFTGTLLTVICNSGHDCQQSEVTEK